MAIVAIHHFLAIYSVSAERYELPFADFASGVLFPAVLIVNFIPLSLAASFGAATSAISGSSSASSVIFVVSFIIFSTIQWVFLSWIGSQAVKILVKRPKPA